MFGIEGALAYMHLDDQSSDAVVVADATNCLNAAKSYVDNFIACRTEENSAMWELAVYGLTLHLFEHRGIAEEKALAEVPCGVRTLMDALKLNS